MQVIADRADHDFAGVEPAADLHRSAVRAPRLLGVPIDRFLHPERGIARADGVVFVRERRAERRHDSVAHHLVHRALVAVHSVHHVGEDRVEDLARFLGIAVGEQLHGALEIGEQNRHVLALALQRSPGREDLLGEVLRSVRLWRGEARPGRGRRSSEGSPAAVTELASSRITVAARRTGELETGTT